MSGRDRRGSDSPSLRRERALASEVAASSRDTSEDHGGDERDDEQGNDDPGDGATDAGHAGSVASSEPMWLLTDSFMTFRLPRLGS